MKTYFHRRMDFVKMIRFEKKRFRQIKSLETKKLVKKAKLYLMCRIEKSALWEIFDRPF